MNDKTKTAPLDSNEKPENEDALVAEIKRLKHERNAIILAHVYQPDEIQQLPTTVATPLPCRRKPHRPMPT